MIIFGQNLKPLSGNETLHDIEVSCESSGIIVKIPPCVADSIFSSIGDGDSEYLPSLGFDTDEPGCNFTVRDDYLISNLTLDDSCGTVVDRNGSFISFRYELYRVLEKFLISIQFENNIFSNAIVGKIGEKTRVISRQRTFNVGFSCEYEKGMVQKINRLSNLMKF